MPTPLNVNIVVPFPVGETPKTEGVKMRKYQDGYKTNPGENPNQVLPYWGQRSTGSVTRFRPYPGMPSNAWYAPTPWDGAMPHMSYWASTSNQVTAALRNRAYGKFKESSIGESSQLGVFVAEGRQAYGMIANRATGLYRAYRELKRGNFRRFLRELSVKPKRKHRSVVRTAAGEASGLWLEYWFGWSPAVNDLFNAYQILTGENRFSRCSGSSGIRLPFRTVNTGGSTNRRRMTTDSCLRIVKTGATVELVNYNAAIRASLGLSNPLSIAWELVPFSFVVDWFTQFGNCLDAMTDFNGFVLHDAYTTTFQKAHHVYVTWNTNYGGYGYNGTYEFTTFQHSREKGLAKPLVLRPKLSNFGTSATRAATAVSLLTAIFLDR